MSQGYYARHEHAPGALLAAAREELNLSVSDVARHLKLSPAQVEALEEGAYDRLPGRVFVRGFLRNYAKLLGIDPQPLLRTIEHEMPQPVQVEEAPPSTEVVMPREQPAKWPMYAGLVVMGIVVLLAVYEFGFNEAPGGEAKEASTAAANTDTAAPASPSEAASASPAQSASVASPASVAPSAAPPAPSKSTGAAATPAPATLPASVAGVRQPTDMKGAPLPQVAEAAAAGQRALRFRFDKDSWVEIRDRNDKVIFSKLNKAGSEERVNGVPPFKLVVGNARSVRVDMDDKPVDLTPHIGVTVARLTLQ
jgi:cytoskeleton protein RodZ